MAPFVYRYAMEKPLEVVPQRVISLVPSVTESLFDLGLGSRLVGITDHCVRPAPNVSRIPKIGTPQAPRLPDLLALMPDLVIASSAENRREDVEALRAAIPVWETNPQTVQDALNLLWTMMDVFDQAEMVHRVRTIEQTVDFIGRIAVTRLQPCRVFVATGFDPLTTIWDNTFAHDLLRVCGGMNVFTGFLSSMELSEAHKAGEEVTGHLPQLLLEKALSAQPDVVMLPDAPQDRALEYRTVFAQMDVPAAKHGRIHFFDPSLLTWPGTRIAYALTEIPALLCPTDET